MKKRLLSLLLAIVMIISLLPTYTFADEVDTTDANEKAVCEDGSPEVLESPLITVYEAEDDFQVLKVDIDENNKAEIYYTAVSDCVLNLTVYDDNSSEQIKTISQNVTAGESLNVFAELGDVPRYYYIEAALSDGNDDLSKIYTYYDNTQAYEEFLNLSPESPEFEDNVILNYGVSDEGTENFAVVSDDVKVIYVDSMNDVEIENDYSDEDEVSLFSFTDEKTTYTFSDVKDDEVLKNVTEGDKVLILPKDDIMQVRTLVVGETETATLFDGEEVISVTADDTTNEDEQDFFDFARIDMDEEVSNPDIDFSDMDEELELVDVNDDYATIEWTGEGEPIDEEEAELFGTSSKTFENEASKTVGRITIKDKLTTKLTVSYDVGWYFSWGYHIDKVDINASIQATNNLTISSTASASISKDWQLGTVKIYGAKFPIKLYANMTVGAKLNANATQTAYAKVGATWVKSGTVTPYAERYADTTYDFIIEGKIRCKIGVGTEKGFGFDIKIFRFSAKAGVQAGVQIDGTATVKSSSDTKTHECDFCLNGKASVYASGNVYAKTKKQVFIDKNFSVNTKPFATFHVSKRNGNWYYGSGDCTYYSYKITFKAVNTKGTALSSVNIYKGSTKLGSTNSKGTFSKKILRGTYNFKVKKSKYNTLSKRYTVSKPANIKIIMSKSGGANETYYTMTDLTEMSNTDFEQFKAEPETMQNTIFRIENAEDLKALSDFVNTSGKDTAGLRFVLNNSDGIIDLGNDEFTPIGTSTNKFKGELDGNSFIIKNLKINSNSDAAGLFGCSEGAYIYNLGVENVDINGVSNVGGLAGIAENKTLIENCYVTGNVSGTSNVGGLTGVSNESEIANCYCTASVTGSENTGGLLGSMDNNAENGVLSNCYYAGELNGNGAIVGKMTYSTAVDSKPVTDVDETSEEDLILTGVQYCYYIDSVAENAVGSKDDNSIVLAYPVTEEQAKDEGSDTYISDDPESYGFTYSLKDALNGWCNAFGNASDEALTETDTDTEASIAAEDNYKEWFDDTGLTNGGYPLFAEKTPVYELTVKYVYEDGSEAKPSVVLYLEEGQKYDVDSYDIEGYSTGDLEYAGVMPGSDMEFRVIYVKDDVFDGSVSELLNSGKAASAGESYSIGNAQDINALANYVSLGKNTKGVIFKVSGGFDVAGAEITPIGTKDLPFEGIFDGNYSSISGLNYSSNADYIALIGYGKGAEIKNLCIGGNVSGNNYVGLIMGYADECNFDNVTALDENTSVNGNSYVGGIIGCGANSSVKTSSYVGSVSGESCVGGIVGATQNTVIKNVSNKGAVNGSDTVGGLCGKIISSEIVNSYNLGNAGSQTAANVGGIAGSVESGNINNCYNSGTVIGSTNVGGVAGVGTANVDSNYYLSGVSSVGNGTEGSNTAFSNETIDTVVEGLNSWIDASNIGGLYAWYIGEESIYPIFGVLNNSWLTDYNIGTDNIIFTYSNDLYSNAVLYVAVYSADNKMMNVKSYNDSGNYTIDMTNASYAKFYIWDKNTQEPVENSLTLNM